MAVDNSKYWLWGLPYAGLTSEGSAKYWSWGLPYGFIEPAAAGTEYTQDVDGVMSFVGDLVRAGQFKRSYAGALASSGTISQETGSLRSGTMDFMGNVTRKTFKSLDSILSFGGGLASALITAGEYIISYRRRRR